MNFYKYLLSIIISFIIISIIILFFISLINNKIESFAIDKDNINITDNNNLMTDLNNNLLIYLKFNRDDLNGMRLIKKFGKHSFDAENVDNNTRFTYNGVNYTIGDIAPMNGCSIDTEEYVKGTGSLKFNGSSGIIQSMNQSYINNQFTVSFFIKNVNNTNGTKTIVSQALYNPTLGWKIQIINSTLQIIAGNNENDSWITVITANDFITKTNNNWNHVALTYNSSSNPRWNLYLDGLKHSTTIYDKINTELILLSKNVNTVINNTLTDNSLNNSLHFLTIGCDLITPVREKVNYIVTDTSRIKLEITNGIYKTNYDYGFIGTTHIYIKFISGTTSLKIPIDCTADVLIVGGGGAGSYNCGWEGGGGGGGGGVGYGTIKFKSNTIYNITVGAGGAKTSAGCTIGGNGGNTSISGGNINEIAYGGGGGGWQTGQNGGSGGGGSGYAGNFSGGTQTRGVSSSAGNSRITYYGNSGGYGYNASGGSGGGGAGSEGVSTGGVWRGNGTNGGNGIQINILDGSYYGGGGGGGCSCITTSTGGVGGIGGGGSGGNNKGSLSVNGTDGGVNTGGGGGGIGCNGRSSGAGGSGIVILKFEIAGFYNYANNIYRYTDASTLRLGNFITEGTLMDDFKLYNVTLNETQIKLLYYGTSIATMDTSSITASGGIDTSTGNCISAEFATSTTLTAIPSSSSLIKGTPSAIIPTPLNRLNRPQYSQSFSLTNYNYNYTVELLFSQLLYSSISPNPYSPVKLFNKDSTDASGINYCAFLSMNALTTTNYTYNYNKDGSYALNYKVPNCGNITFSEAARPSGDYIYMKFPEAFILSRYAIKAINGYKNRAPGRWTLFIYNPSTQISVGYTYPPESPLNSDIYCNLNQQKILVDMNYSNISVQVPTSEYLFVFHNIVGNNDADNYGMLAFQELVLYKNSESQ